MILRGVSFPDCQTRFKHQHTVVDCSSRKAAIYDESYTVSFGGPIWTYGLVVEASLSGDMGSIRHGEKISAAPRPLCVALSPSLDLDAGFYIAERSIFLSSLEHLESGLDSATCEDLAHTMIGIDYSDCISSELFTCHVFRNFFLYCC